MSSKAKFEPHHGQPFLVQASPGFLESVPDEETPESLYEKHERVLKDELARMFARLPSKESEAITLWLHGMTQAEIAKRDNVTQAAISIRAKRGIEKLFEMRDRGELGTLKFIWDGLHTLKDHINKEIALERAADSDVTLPLGEEVGEHLGDWVRELQVGEQEPEHDTDPAPPPAPEKKPRKMVRRCANGVLALNEKEDAVLSAIKRGPTIHIKQIESTARLTNLEVRNSLRKLVRQNFITKTGKGMYAPCM